MSSIQAPTHCPSCESELVWLNHLLYCKNTSCASQAQKKVEHFAKTVKIKGLGPAAVAKLGLSDIDQIYEITLDEIEFCLNSKKLAEKLYAEIQNSKTVSLNTLLPAFSIPLIGKTAADKLATVCNSIVDINEENCSAAGLGPKATDSLLNWLSKEFYCFYDGALPFDFKFVSSSKKVEKVGTVCISGKLKSFKTKAEATQVLTNAGYEVKSSLTKDCTHLINESGIESSKTQTARDRGVIIITSIDELLI